MMMMADRKLTMMVERKLTMMVDGKLCQMSRATFPASSTARGERLLSASDPTNLLLSLHLHRHLHHHHHHHHHHNHHHQLRQGHITRSILIQFRFCVNEFINAVVQWLFLKMRIHL